MNIGIVTPYFPDSETLNSGIANHYATLANGLSTYGHSVVVLHVRPRYSFETDAHTLQQISPCITLITLKISLGPVALKLFGSHWALKDVILKLKCMRAATLQLPGLVKRYRLEVIETSSYFTLIRPYALKIRIPVAIRVSTTFSQIMQDYYPFQSRLLAWFAGIEAKLIKKTTHLLTHTHNHAKEIAALHSIPEIRFQIIPHGVDLPPYVMDVPLPKETLRVLFVGRFEYRKGIDVLLKAIPIVAARCHNVVFDLIGADPGNTYIHTFVNSQPPHILKRLSFRETLDDTELNAAYRACDIFVAPSRYESFGLIYIEAMSYGKPVIGCRAGGVPEIIRDGYNGFLAIPGDHESLADKIVVMATNAELRVTMGLNARKVVEKHYSSGVLVTNSLAYYQQLADL